MARIPKLKALPRARRVVLGALLGLGAAVLLSLARTTDLVESLELQLVDVRTRQFADQGTPDPRIVIMQIEESDLARVNEAHGVRWPWPLEINAHLVDVLHEAGARALMVDILHLDRGAGPDDVPGTEELSEAMRAERRMEAEQAQKLGRALATFGRASVAFELSAAPAYDLPARRGAAVSKLGDQALPGHPNALRRSGAELPVIHITQSATLLGFSNIPGDVDGVARRAATFGRWGERVVLSLPLATARLATGERVAAEDGAVLVGHARQPVDEEAAFLVNFHGAGLRGGYARVAPTQVLEWKMRWDEDGQLPAEAREALAGKIVVLGINIAGIKDVVAAPLGPADGSHIMDGPVFQATVLDNLLHGDGRVRISRGANLVWLFLLTIVVGGLSAAVRGRVFPHLLAAAAGTLFVAFACLQFGRGLSLDLFTPLLGIVLTWGGTSAVHAFTEGRRNRWLEATFGRYMAPSIIAALKRDPALLELGGREREISVLFSDIAGFTGMATRLGARDIVTLLNRYLTGHCEAVMNHGGVVDKFEGDAVMAFYGDPVATDGHALQACRTALQVQADLPRLAPLLDTLGVDAFTVRVGINTGQAVVGNMGSNQRFDYTCMGDTVNLASRLEGAGKAFGASILIGQDTATEAGRAVLLKSLGRVVVVGRSEPVPVFELLALREAASTDLVAHAEAFERALASARTGDMDTAHAALDEAVRLRPNDGPVAWLRGVLTELGSNSWDGTTVLERK